MLKTKKLTAVILILSILFLCAAMLSCNNNQNKGRIPVSPDGGAYQVMLKPEWTAIKISENIDTLAIQHKELSLMVIIECYTKANLADVNITDIDGFMKFYKLFNNTKETYENENNNVEELRELTAKEMKKTQLTAGKRQIVLIAPSENTANVNLTTEYIYLEMAKHYFLVSYSVQNENHTDDVINAVNDVIYNIQTD